MQWLKHHSVKSINSAYEEVNSILIMESKNNSKPFEKATNFVQQMFQKDKGLKIE